MFFKYRSQVFVYDPPQGRFIDSLTIKPLLPDVQEGLSKWTVESRQLTYGKNQIAVPHRSIFELLWLEVLDPLFFFQILAIIVWILDEYYYYTVVLFITSLISAGTALKETKRQDEQIRKLAHFEFPVRVLRGMGNWEFRRSIDLVPGDVVQVDGLKEAPCDLLLAGGGYCIVNESMLTGESTPVTKTPPPKHVSLQSFIDELDLRHTQLPSDAGKHVIFGGTELVQSRRRNVGGQWKPADRVLAVCLRTGFRTMKGALIRSMLHPKPHEMRFFRDCFLFIMALAVLALLGFLYTVFLLLHQGASVKLIILRGLIVVTIVVPTSLPTTLTIGMNFAIKRLKMYNIYCTSPQRINLCGKINLMCFDKTGTLTEDGLQILGVQSAASVFQTTGRIPELAKDLTVADSDPNLRELANCLRTCHHITMVNGQLVGDPRDLQMFRLTGWELEEDLCHSPEIDLGHHSDEDSGSSSFMKVRSRGVIDGRGLEVLWHFQFVSWLRRASVIVQDLSVPEGSEERHMVFTKGAPEMVASLCEPSTIPARHDEWLEYYTRQGHHVISCAGKPFIPSPGVPVTSMNFHRLERSDVECDLKFLGFVVFENPLKHDSPGAIQTLEAANISCKICTGDHVGTALSVARRVGMIGEAEAVFTSTLQEEHYEVSAQDSPDSRPRMRSKRRLVFTKEDDPNVFLDVTTMTPICPPRSLAQSISTEIEHRPHTPERPDSVRIDIHSRSPLHSASLAVTGPCYEFMSAHVPQHDLDRILVKSKVFTRMSPDQKQDLVERYKDLGYTTGFCGDGANDCQALKAAHVGLSFSEAKASIAASFTSQRFSVEAVVHLIREGRAALVTSFSCFKFETLCSLIQFTSVILLYAYRSNLDDIQFVYFDLFIMLPIGHIYG